MPQIIPIIAYAVKAVLVYYGASQIVAYVVATVVAVGLSKVAASKLRPSDADITAANTAQLQLTRGTVNVDEIGYGQSRRSGTLMFLDVSGNENDNLWQVIHLVGHEVDSIPSVYFDDYEITNAMIDVNGAVTSGKFGGGRVIIKRYLGTSAQLADPLLVAEFGGDGRWTSNDRARGNAYLVIKMIRDDDDSAVKKFPHGPPNTISAQIRLRKVYDPRLDSTAGGAGSHRADDKATWQWSDNPALCARDYLCFGNSVDPDGAGMAEDHTIINVNELAAAANRCDTIIEFPGSVFLKQYTCNGFLRTSSTMATNKDFLEQCMLGKIFYSGGQWHIFAGGYDTPTVTLTTKDFAGDVFFDTTLEHSERFNEFRAIYQNAVEGWREQESLPRKNDTYKDDDGEYLPGTLNLPLTSHEFTAQYISFMALQQTRNMQQFAAPMKPRAVDLRAWDTVLIHVPELGWVNKSFKIVQWKLGALGLPDISFREDKPELWDWVPGNATARTFTDPTDPAVEKPPAPTNLIATSLPEVVHLSWDIPIFSAFEYIEILRADEGQAFVNAQVLNRVAGEDYDDPLPPGVKKRYWVRAVNRYGERSGQEPLTTSGVLAEATSPSSTVTLIARGNCVITTNNVQKVGGSSAWDSDCYSVESFPNGCILTFRPAQINADLMIGLNSDPTTDQNFTGLDFAIRLTATGTVQVYESNVVKGTFGSYTTADTFTIEYTGSLVRYRKNGLLFYGTVSLGKILFVDSSFFTPGGKVFGVSLVPMAGAIQSVLFTMVPRGNCQFLDGVLQKVGGAAAWDSDCYSLDAFSAGCLLKFNPTQSIGVGYMIGLNSDPITDQSYTSLDHAWYQNETDNNWYIWESNVAVTTGLGSVLTTDTPVITYDGIYVRYYLNGVLKREVQNPGKVFFFDCSFNTPGAAVEKVYFGPANSAPASRLIPRGQCVVVGNTIQKVGGSGAWDSDCYSAETFTGGCAVSWRFRGASVDNFLIGLNSDPTTDQSYTSLDYSIQCFGSDHGGPGFVIYESGVNVASGPAAANDVFSVRYDGQWVRYYKNSILHREKFDPGKILFIDSSFLAPGTVVVDVSFGPLTSVTPDPFIARGLCRVSGSSVTKQGGTNAWGDSDCYSIVGYPTCHVVFKANQTNAAIMVGLSEAPTFDMNFTSITHAWYVRDDGVLLIYENGTLISTHGSYTTSTELSITYDGTNVRYYKDRVLQRTIANGGEVFFMDSSFHSANGGINSLVFGPTTTIGAVATSQIEPNAATDIYTSVTDSVTFSCAAFGSITSALLSITIPAQPFAYELLITASARCWVTNPGEGLLYVLSDSTGVGSVVLSGTRILQNNSTADRYTLVAEQDVPVNEQRVIRFWFQVIAPSVAFTFDAQDVILQAEVIKR